jgi:hypothetical protein
MTISRSATSGPAAPGSRDTLRPRAVLLLVGAISAWTGGWAAVAPSHFFAHYPGWHLSWVHDDGPYNAHLVRDVGTLNLAVAAFAVAACLRPVRVLLLATVVAVEVNAVPHLCYHLATVGHMHRGIDRWSSVTALGMAVLLPLAALPWPVPQPLRGVDPVDDKR